MAERIPPATRTLAVSSDSSFPRDGEAYANAPVMGINADKLREPTYIRLASNRTLSLSLSLSLVLAASPDGDGATLTVPGLVTL